MKYCLKHYPDSKLEESDEVIYNFKSSTKAIDFIELYNDRRIIFLVNLNEPKASLQQVIDVAIAAKEKYPQSDFAIMTSLEALTPDIVTLLKEKKVDCFCVNMAGNWIDFLKLANLGFSDVYIGDDLGFDLKRLSKVAKELQVKLRVFPNAAHSVWNDMPSIKKFFIKPEDIAIYEDFIDVIEFFCNTPAIEKTLYSIYKDRMKWTGSLGDIISGLNLDLTSNSLVDNFTLGRINCARKCLKGNACNRCDKALELADHMKEHKMELTPINKKEGSNGKRSDSETRDNEQNT